jgi:methyl-accepting chemotaxis protein
MLNGMKVSQKVLTGIFVIIALMFIVGIVGFVGLRSVNTQTELITGRRIPMIMYIQNVNNATSMILADEGVLLNRRLLEQRNSAYSELEKYQKIVRENLEEFAKLEMRQETRDRFNKVSDTIDDWMKDHDKFIEINRQKDALLAQGVSPDSPEMAALDKQMLEASRSLRNHYDSMDGLTAEMISWVSNNIADNTKAIAKAESTATILLVIILLVGLVIGIVLGASIGRGVNKSLNSLINEVVTIGDAVENGQIDKRSDTNAIDSEFRPIAEGINKIIEAFVAPVSVFSEYVDRIAVGDIPPKITQTFKGGFDVTRKSMNNCVDAISGLVAEAKMLTKAAVDGQLSTRGDAGKFSGDFAAIVKGINDTLDGVIGPMNEAMDTMAKLARKDMTARVKGTYKGDLNEFKQNINNAADNLEDALSQVDMAVEQISSAATQISSGSQSLAEGTSEQASSLEEIASSLEEMNSLTQGNADNSRQGSQLAELALGNVNKGNMAMSQMNEAMIAIYKSAEQTQKIIKTIDEIAFQTNLLALNAAVEAAHAGEAGKGFAVVAEEVKNLALRSAEAAKNTNELIEGSLKNSESGVKIVDDVSHSFLEIKASFEKVNSIVREISASSDEQAQGISQVNVAIAELNRVTQQAAANAEESASAAEELNSQSAELRSMVSEFQITGSRSRSRTNSYDRRKQSKHAIPNKARNLLEVPPSKVLPLNEAEDKDFEDF